MDTEADMDMEDMDTEALVVIMEVPLICMSRGIIKNQTYFIESNT